MFYAMRVIRESRASAPHMHGVMYIMKLPKEIVLKVMMDVLVVARVSISNPRCSITIVF